jgi:hypothetical protein
MDAALGFGQPFVCGCGLRIHAGYGRIGRVAARVVPLAGVLHRLQLPLHLLRSMLGGIGTKTISGFMCAQKHASDNGRDRQHGSQQAGVLPPLGADFLPDHVAPPNWCQSLQGPA